MEEQKKYILTVNMGSSSLKMGVYKENDHNNAVARLDVKNIGTSQTKVYWQKTGPEKGSSEYAIPKHSDALRAGISWVEEIFGVDPFVAVAYRVVHGGPDHYRHEKITRKVFEDLKDFAQFDPDHMPETLRAVAVLAGRYKKALHIACYDTDFFANMPDISKRLPLPRTLDGLGVRRFGFHGLSYTYLKASLAEKQGGKLKSKKIVMAHLGSGSSVTAIKNGQPVDTTMSFSPTSGIMMSTRSGDIDPSILVYLHKKGGLSLTLLNQILNKESGLKGVSGMTGDMYTLIEKSSSHKHAKEAVDMYCNQVVKSISGYAGLMGGIDALIFAGGIGEASSFIRKEICNRLGFLGLNLNYKANNKHKTVLSKRNSDVKVYRFVTDESQVMANIARNELGLIGRGK